MEILAELLLSLLGWLAELLLQLLFQLLAESAVHVWRRAWKHLTPWAAWLAVPFYLALGAGAGWLSVWLMPSAVLPAGAWRWVNLIVSPFVAGGVAMAVGAWRRRRGEPTVRLDHFAWAFLFALALAAVRLRLAD